MYRTNGCSYRWHNPEPGLPCVLLLFTEKRGPTSSLFIVLGPRLQFTTTTPSRLSVNTVLNYRTPGTLGPGRPTERQTPHSTQTYLHFWTDSVPPYRPSPVSGSSPHLTLSYFVNDLVLDSGGIPTYPPRKPSFYGDNLTAPGTYGLTRNGRSAL